MATQYSFGKINNNGLVLLLDAADRNSYPGTGTSWVDLSGGSRNFTLSGPVWDSTNGGRFYFDGTNDVATGPASNTFGFSYDVTIEVVLNPTDYIGGSTFNFFADGVNSNRGYHAHTPYGNGYYWDVHGCCGTDTRITYIDNGDTFRNKIGHFVFRARSTPTPRRNIFRNNVSLVDSSTNTNAGTATFSSTSAVIGGRAALNEWFRGYIHLFRVYNRALSDDELTINYNQVRSRFGI